MNELAGFFVSQTASMQESRTRCCRGRQDAEGLCVRFNRDRYCEQPNQTSACSEHKRSQFLKCSHSDRDVFELARLLLVSWYSACVKAKDADDRHRRQQDSKLENASGDHVDIAHDKVLMNQNDTSVAAMAGPKDVTENTVRVVGDLECAVSSVKMGQQRSHRRTILTGRDEWRQFCETHQGIRTTVWVTGNLTSNTQRNRYVQQSSHVDGRPHIQQRQTYGTDIRTLPWSMLMNNGLSSS